MSEPRGEFIVIVWLKWLLGTIILCLFGVALVALIKGNLVAILVILPIRACGRYMPSGISTTT